MIRIPWDLIHIEILSLEMDVTYISEISKLHYQASANSESGAETRNRKA